MLPFDFQYGFKSSLYTEDLLIILLDRIARALSKCPTTWALALDISTWYGGLLQELKSYGFWWLWMENLCKSSLLCLCYSRFHSWSYSFIALGSWVQNRQLRSTQPFILPIKWVLGTPRDWVVKSKLFLRSDSVALRLLNPIHKKGAVKFFLLYTSLMFLTMLS